VSAAASHQSVRVGWSDVPVTRFQNHGGGDRQTVAKPSMRALASAIILLTATRFGQGIGPLAVGMLNDALKNDYGANAVRYSLLRRRSRPCSARCGSFGRNLDSRGRPRVN
jgi:hypothetical protein